MSAASNFLKVFLVTVAIAAAVAGTLAVLNYTSVINLQGGGGGGNRISSSSIMLPTAEELARIRAEHFANIMSRPSSQHVVIPSTQEVVMTGTPSRVNGCLGQEFLVEVKNDIGADQLDISYSTTLESSTMNKAASCGKESIVKQCIPDLSVKLFATAYYYGDNEREEKRVYPEILLKGQDENSTFLNLLASDFILSSS